MEGQQSDLLDGGQSLRTQQTLTCTEAIVYSSEGKGDLDDCEELSRGHVSSLRIRSAPERMSTNRAERDCSVVMSPRAIEAHPDQDAHGQAQEHPGHEDGGDDGEVSTMIVGSNVLGRGSCIARMEEEHRLLSECLLSIKHWPGMDRGWKRREGQEKRHAVGEQKRA